MLNIQIICIGKLKENHWHEAEAEYVKRLKPYAKIEIIELPEEPFRDGFDPEKIKVKEAEKLQKYISNEHVVIALHEYGKEYSSPELAHFFEEHSTRGEKIVCIVGGPLGLHESLLKQIPLKLSLSKLTFPHQMVRTILLEQIYRGVTIMKGKQYHY